MSDQQMILILVLAFFLLGCSFSCNGLKEDFALSPGCRAKLSNANLCALWNEKKSNNPYYNPMKGNFIADIISKHSECTQSQFYDINSHIPNSTWNARHSCR